MSFGLLYFILVVLGYNPRMIESFSINVKSGGILLLDHLNINHEKGRHDLLKAFYFETLGLSIDPRKEENLSKGRKGLWANAGITQFHLGEGEPAAQTLNGIITLAYKSTSDLSLTRKSLEKARASSILSGSKFSWSEVSGSESIEVTDPWGSKFRLIVDPNANDPRGVQPGPSSLPSLVSDLTFHIPHRASLSGIERFYKYVFNAPTIISPDVDEIKVIVSPYQTLTYAYPKDDTMNTCHTELDRNEVGKAIANSGPHISLYIQDFESCYLRAQELGSIFVNQRFKRQAFTVEEAIDQCMFRCLDIIDPEEVGKGPILQLEHEVRSTKNKDGSKYKSCPLSL